MSKQNGATVEAPTKQAVMSGKAVREVLALFVPHLEMRMWKLWGRMWGEKDFVLLSAIFGMNRSHLERFARRGVESQAWARYFCRLRNTFRAAEMWLGLKDTIQFFSTPSWKLGERPIDYLRRDDCSFRLMVDEITRECGTEVHLVENVLPSW